MSAIRSLVTPSSGSRYFYGWTIVGAVFITMTVSSGIGFYNASVILSAATGELDASVGSVSGGPAIFFGVSGVTAFALARRMDSVDLRWFYGAGGMIGALSLISLRWVESVWGLYGFFALFGTGFALAGLVPGTTLVTRWFHIRRSVALSIASTGLSLGGIVITPVSAWLIGERGLAGAGPILAGAWLVGIVPVGAILIRSRPSEVGMEPDGTHVRMVVPQPSTTAVISDGAVGSTPPRDMVGSSFRQAISTRFFVMLSVAYGLIFFAQVGALAHLFNLTTERVDSVAARYTLSVMALTSVLGRLAGGVVVARVSTKTLTAVLTLVQGASLVALATSFSATTILAAAIVMGLSVGNLLMLQPLLMAEAFGVAAYSRIYSFNQLFGTIGVAGGPVGLGLVHDGFSYTTAFVVAASASLVGFVAIMAAGPVTKAQALWQTG